uniref:Tudor domain-containing protein n=1 Tax=Strongyloides papillosus TaxID=174720 RepID=A0A0N5BNI3_STREA
MGEQQLKSQIDFLNDFFNFGKEFEELGCSPTIISCHVSFVNYNTRQVWLQPIEAHYLEKKLSKLLIEWKKKIKNFKSIEENEIIDKKIYIYSTVDGKLGRCYVVKRNEERPSIQCIDVGKTETLTNDTKIYEINNDMISGELCYPLCFVVDYIPNAYCQRYGIPEISDIKAGSFIHAVIINVADDVFSAFIFNGYRMLYSIKNEFFKMYELGGKLKVLDQICKGKRSFSAPHWGFDKAHRITDEYTDGFVIGVPDHEHIYVRSIDLTIAYLFFVEFLNKYYNDKRNRGKLSVNKINPSNSHDLFVLYDSETTKFYRVSIISFNSQFVNCYCIDQPTLVFKNIRNEPDFLWKLKDFFMLPKFVSLVKLGNFKTYGKSNNTEINERRSRVLKLLFKNNNQVQIINNCCEEFLTVEHEGSNIVTKFKNKLVDLHGDNIDLAACLLSDQKILKRPSFGEFGKSLNASFCKKGNVLGKSLRDLCIEMPKNRTSCVESTEAKIPVDSFGMYNPKDSTLLPIDDYFDEEEEGSIDEFVKEFNKLKENTNIQLDRNYDSLTNASLHKGIHHPQYKLEAFSITNFVNENEVYIFSSEILMVYEENYKYINSYDTRKFKEIKLENVLPDTVYLIKRNEECYRVVTGNNFSNNDRGEATDSSSEDEALEDFFFLEIETKRQFKYNRKMKIYSCPLEIIKLPYPYLEVVSLSEKILDSNYDRLNLEDKIDAIKYLKKSIPLFKNNITMLGKFMTTNMGNRKILTLSTIDGTNIVMEFQKYCKDLYIKSRK